MKILEFNNFREYDLKYAKIQNNEQIKQSYSELENAKEILGIIFLDNGINFKVIEVDGNKVLNKSIILKDLIFLDPEIQLQEQKQEHLELLIDDLKKTYYPEQIQKLRDIKKIDSLRSKLNPDIVEAFAYTKTKPIEVLSCMLEMPTDVEDVFVAKLLNSSKYDEELKIDKSVALKYLFQDNEPYLIVGGIVNFYED